MTGEDQAELIGKLRERVARWAYTTGKHVRVTAPLRELQAVLAALSSSPPSEREVLELIDYLFGDDRNGNGVRVVDLCFTAFMNRDKPNPEDGEKSDWFNDTKPIIDKGIARIKDRILALLSPQQGEGTR